MCGRKIPIRRGNALDRNSRRDLARGFSKYRAAQDWGPVPAGPARTDCYIGLSASPAMASTLA